MVKIPLKIPADPGLDPEQRENRTVCCQYRTHQENSSKSVDDLLVILLTDKGKT